MKATFQDKYLHVYIGMNTTGITHLYGLRIVTRKFITNCFLSIFSATFLAQNITGIKKNLLFYTRNITLSSSKFQVGTLSDNYRRYLVQNIENPKNVYNEYITSDDVQAIALKIFFPQSFLVKSHVLEVP